jgi:hypothetical protein
MGIVEIGHMLALTTQKGLPLGSLRVEELKGDWVIGAFEPLPGYAEHRAIFLRWTNCVNDGSLSCLDEIGAEIAALRISVTNERGVSLASREIQICDEVNRSSVAIRF